MKKLLFLVVLIAAGYVAYFTMIKGGSISSLLSQFNIPENKSADISSVQAPIRLEENDKNDQLRQAARSGNMQVVKFLLRNGADKFTTEFYGETLLHLAAESGNYDLFAHLTEQGLDLTIKTARGYTVLHAAARGGNAKLVQILMERGLDPKAKDNDGRTPLDYAKAAKHKPVISMLSKR